MNFKQMLTYFKLKNMISNHYVISMHLDHDTGLQHAILSIRVSDRTFRHAKILYRQDSGRISLIYADIFYTGNDYITRSTPDKMLIKNAKNSDLENQLIDHH